MLAWWPPTLLSLLILENVYNLIYCPHSIQVHHCNENLLLVGSHPNVFLFPPGGWQIRGTGRVQTGSATFEGSREPQWEKLYWLRLHVVFFKMQVMRELKNEFIKMIWDVFSHARDRHEAFFVVLVVEPSDKWQRWKDGMVQGCQVIGRVTLQNRNS